MALMPRSYWVLPIDPLNRPVLTLALQGRGLGPGAAARICRQYPGGSVDPGAQCAGGVYFWGAIGGSFRWWSIGSS